jgi:hypothetical protein
LVSTIFPSLQLAYNPHIIDGEHIDKFYDRWGDWLAKVAVQHLEKPPLLAEVRNA